MEVSSISSEYTFSQMNSYKSYLVLIFYELDCIEQSLSPWHY